MGETVFLCALAVLTALGGPAARGAGESKAIRLRAGVIQTSEPGRRAVRGAGSTQPLTGLYLLQFTDRVRPAWREDLGPRKVRLLSYVPDDAYVVRLEGADGEAVRSLPFVRWLGAYEPGYRLDRRLARTMSLAQPGAAVAIQVLVAPGVDAIEEAVFGREFRLRRSGKSGLLGTVFSGTVRGPQVAALIKSPLVLWVEGAPRMRLLDEVATKIVAGEEGEPGSAAAVHNLGFDGRGVVVAVPDSGLDTGDRADLHPDLAGRVDALFAYGGLPDASDEHSHGTHCAGIIAGNAATGETDDSGSFYGLGVAPGAHLVGQRIFDAVGEYYAPPSFERLTRDAVRSGAVLGSNSWGDEAYGQYDLSAAQFDALVRDADAVTPGEQPFLLEFSAGNSGPGRETINSPALAKNVIATGACQNNRYEFLIYGDGQEATADFSSRGPCEDGRIKPDLMAPGTWIASVKSQYAGDENAWASISPYYIYQGGTSQAGPHAAGAAAVFVQYYRQTEGGATPSPALIKAALINSATDMGVGWRPSDDPESEPEQVGDTDPVPNSDEGWGRVDLTNLIGTDRRCVYVEQGTGLSTGRTFEQRVVVSPNDPFKVTLVYTDVPGLPAAIPALVNDLDLEVVGPDGRVYRGNAFLGGESVADTTVGDRVNNVEAVHLAEPMTGDYRVRVRAFNVVEDVHGRSGVIPEQDFVLVISGDLPASGEGVIFFDRSFYPAPSVALIRLIDAQLTGTASVQVSVRSETEAGGETLVLAPAGVVGVFTNAMALESGPAQSGDHRLQVAHGETVTATYHDANPAGERLGSAQVDLLPPALTGVQALSRYGRTMIHWETDEPGTSRVVFGQENGAAQEVSGGQFVWTHDLELPSLEAGLTFQYYVVSTDRAGNTATNDNGGLRFWFKSVYAAPVLLLYSPESGWDEWLGEIGFGYFPGRENWTEPLDELGVAYEIWDFAERDGVVPTAEDLKPFRVVLWRPEELLGDVPSGLTDALTSYLSSGGSLFVCSFDLLTRLSLPADVQFKTDVLHVTDSTEDQGALQLVGAEGDPLSRGMAMDLDYSEFPDLSPWFGSDVSMGPDHLEVGSEAAPLFVQEEGQVVGARFPRVGADSTNRVIFCSVPFEAIPRAGDVPNNRTTFLAQALEFLAPGLRGLAQVAFDRPAYGIPAAATLEITDARRAGAGSVTAQILTTRQPVAAPVALSETVRPGVFRALVTLVSTHVPSGAQAWEVAHGDLVEARYVDSAGRETGVSSLVDTVAPVISEIVVEPAYNEAWVTWETSKAADSLVQFDSVLFPFPVNRTAYSPTLSFTHGVQLDGLLPDREYVFQVRSRDGAGNVAVDDDAGRLYRFRTLKPVTAPWADDLESGRTGWAVYNDEEAVDDETGENLLNSGWQHGVPENAEGISAHSGAKCWATNLRGDLVSLAISDLVSPAVELPATAKATLRFAQYYDFTERSELLDLEVGQVAISTDNGVTWSLIYSVTDDFSLGWEEVDVDLTKYAGEVVRVLWDYQMFSFDEYARPGWFIDDVRVTLEAAQTGRLSVSNNLDQATFTLAGPRSLGGAGRSLELADAPVGTYEVTWASVPYYVTPAARTNTVSTNSAALFEGVYTFPDANGNGMSDLFEERFFGSAQPQHPWSADSDGDGSSDGAEFQAGTDPTQAGSRLAMRRAVIQSNRTVLVEWASVTGHAYCLEMSTDLGEWLPASEWIRATGSTSSTLLPPLQGARYYFRVQVRP